MKQTVIRLVASIIDLAGDIGTEAEALPQDAGISGAEAIIHLRNGN